PRVAGLVDILEPLPGPRRRRRQGFRLDAVAAPPRLGEGPDRHGPVVARGALVLLPPLRRVLLQECQAPLDRPVNLPRAHGGWRRALFLRIPGANRPHDRGQQTEESQGTAEEVAHGTASLFG